MRLYQRTNQVFQAINAGDIILVFFFFLSSFPPPGPPCSLLTSCSSWSCCYLKPRLVAKVETPARSTMAGCPLCLPLCHSQTLPAPSWSPVWLTPSKVSCWTDWACSHSLTRGLGFRCRSTSWISTASTRNSTIYWRILRSASPASTSSRPTLSAASTTAVSLTIHMGFEPYPLWDTPNEKSSRIDVTPGFTIKTLQSAPDR